MATDRIIEHIDRLREKPPHVRERIALLTAAGVTGLVAVTWMGALASSGTLALKATPAPAPVAESAPSFSRLVGAADAAFGVQSNEPELEIVEGRRSSTLDAQQRPANATNKTVIPF